MSKRFSAILIMIIVILSGCGEKFEVVKPTNSNPVKGVTMITSGRVNVDGEIAVKFSENQISADDVKKDTRNNSFSFKPGLDGKVYWYDSKTVAFKPFNPIPRNSRYSGTLDLSKLFPEVKNIANDKIPIEFYTGNRKLEDYNIEFGDSRVDSSKAELKGYITLNEKSKADVVKKALIMKDWWIFNKKFTVETKDDKKFTFYSEPIERGKNVKSYNFIIDKKALSLNESIVKNLLLAPRGVLMVEGVEQIEQNGYPKIKVVFSEEMDNKRAYNSSINITPNVDGKYRVDGRFVMISGNFEKGKKYNVTINDGIKSKSGSTLNKKQVFSIEIKIGDTSPKIEFTNRGAYMASANNNRVAFRTLNVERVYVKLKRVSEDNLVSFFEEYSSIASTNYSFKNVNNFSFRRVGQTVDSKMFYIGKTKDNWVQSEIDISEAISKQKHGLYVLQIEFNGDDCLTFPNYDNEWDRQDYVENNGKILKNIIVTNLGVTAKVAAKKMHIFVTDVISAKPVGMASVKIKDNKNKVIKSGMTGMDGYCSIEGVTDECQYVEVKFFNQYTIMRMAESELSTSLFDVGGNDVQGGIKAFVYSDRGVYRPGDTVNLSVVCRNEKHTFPENHPVILQLFNPQSPDTVAYEYVSKTAKDGFYNFNFETDASDPTGNWIALVKVGSASFKYNLRLEEIVPYRIKVNIDPGVEELTLENKLLNVNINSKYLFGSPAEGLNTKVDIKVEPYIVTFPRYKNYTFNNESISFAGIESYNFENKLDKNGNCQLSWQLPEIKDVASGLKLNINAKVFEEGGRPVPKTLGVPYKVFNRYVGIMKLESDEIATGSKVNFNVILVDNKGDMVQGQELKYKIYRLDKYWWWESEDVSDFRTHFKSDSSVALVQSGSVYSSEKPVTIDFNSSDYGEILIEVEDTNGGHKAGYFFRSYWWGASQTGKGSDAINIKCDKEKYSPGDTAKIAIKTPDKGSVLVVVEKGEKIVYRKWEELKSANTEIKIPLTEDMIPNAYVYLAILQPFEQTKNDLPLRMYGIVPLKVENKTSHLGFTIKAPESIQPFKDFSVEINTTDKKSGQFTVAVVDEGLLDITEFKTPNPWDYFFSKERLMFRTYDVYSDFINLTRGIVNKVYSLGGDGDGSDQSEFRMKELSPEMAKRFRAVAMFKGPFYTDNNGYAKVDFTMPDYNGAVRVMVIGARGESYGSAEKSIAVKAPLMVNPTLPRVLGPEDEIEIPVQVFATVNGVGNVSVTIETDGPVKVVGETQKSLTLSNTGGSLTFFKVAASAETGIAKIRIKGSSSEYKAENETEIAVRPYNPYTFSSEAKIVKENSSIKFTVPQSGVKGSGNARLVISSRKNLSLDKRIKWLIKYPYGCIEQTTSSIFPQLYLKEFANLTSEQLNEIDKNINEGINRIMKFQTDIGGFAYWPGGREPSKWGTNYAGHFLIEAQKAGYSVPDDMMTKWFEYQQEQTKSNDNDYLERAYRVYLLALAKRPASSAMNILRENHLKNMDNPEKHYLAAAYKLAGFDKAADEIMAVTNMKVKDYIEFADTYGSTLRDKSIILETLTTMTSFDKALPLFNEIAANISADDWYSTQTLGYSLLALGKYINATSKLDSEVRGEVLYKNGKADFSTTKVMCSVQLNDHFGEEITLANHSNIPLYASLDWEGIPVKDIAEDTAKNLNLTVEWLDENGNRIEPTELKQGTTFWGHFRITKSYNQPIQEMALVQIIPSGWEIENTRLLGQSYPGWTSKYTLNSEEYTDIRDDRIMWFFDFDQYGTYDFLVKLNCVTVGEFYLSSTLAEAMYNNNFKAVVKGKRVKVIGK